MLHQSEPTTLPDRVAPAAPTRPAAPPAAPARPAVASAPPAPLTAPAPLPSLSTGQVRAIAESIARWQHPSGMILWFPDGHTDPWNHVEAAMALTVGGLFDEARRAYGWLRQQQLPNGAWHQYYLADRIEDDKLDTNCVAYVATGVWHHFLSTGDRDFLEQMWPVVRRAIDFVCDAQTGRGEIIWARHADGTPWPFALLTGSSSVCHSLACATKIAEHLGQPQPRWQDARQRLARTIADVPEAFEPKERWAMDWYYPVLSGALSKSAAAQRLAQGWDVFVLEGKGVRCVSDKDWITTAETAECAIAHYVAGQHDTAAQLLEWATKQTDGRDRFWTGTVYPQRVRFPAGEKTTYSAAAMVLAAAVLGAVPSDATRLTFEIPS